MSHKFRTSTGLKEIFIYPAKVIGPEPRIAEPDKFERLMWLPIKGYLNSRLPTVEYVKYFARATHPSEFNEAFKREITGLESIV